MHSLVAVGWPLPQAVLSSLASSLQNNNSIPFSVELHGEKMTLSLHLEKQPLQRGQDTTSPDERTGASKVKAG